MAKLERWTIEHLERNRRGGGQESSMHTDHQSIMCQGREFKNLEHITGTSGRQAGNTDGKGWRTWTKRWLQMSIESVCGWERSWKRGRTWVSRTYLKCQSKSQPGNLWRCCYGHPKLAKSRHGANILIDSLCLKQIAGLTKSWSAILEMRCRRGRGGTKEREYSEAKRYFVGVASGGAAWAGERAYVYARLFTT